MSQQPLSDRVRAVGLPLDKIIVIGGGVLDAYGIREAHDIDIAVESSLFSSLSSLPGWTVRRAQWGELYYEKGDCEAWSGWTEPDNDTPTYEDLLPHTVEIDGIRYMTLEYVKAWKEQKGREKDIRDVALIEAYEAEHHV